MKVIKDHQLKQPSPGFYYYFFRCIGSRCIGFRCIAGSLWSTSKSSRAIGITGEYGKNKIYASLKKTQMTGARGPCRYRRFWKSFPVQVLGICGQREKSYTFHFPTSHFWITISYLLMLCFQGTVLFKEVYTCSVFCTWFLTF